MVLHNDHSTTKLSTAAKAHRDLMGQQIRCAEKILSTLATAIAADNKILEQIRTLKDKAEKAIQHTFQQLSETIEIRKQTLLLELETIALSKLAFHHHWKERLEMMQQDIGHYTELNSSSILQIESDSKGRMPTEFIAQVKKAKIMAINSNQGICFIKSLQADSLVKELSQFGTIMDSDAFVLPHETLSVPDSLAWVHTPYQITMQTKTSMKRKYKYIRTMLIPKSHDMPVVTGHVENKGSGVYAITVTPQTTGLHHIQITVDGLKVDMDYTTLSSPHKVVNFIKQFCVITHKNGDIYVGSHEGLIYVFDTGGRLKNIICTTEVSAAANMCCDDMRGPIGCSETVVSTLADAIAANDEMMEQIEEFKERDKVTIQNTFQKLTNSLKIRLETLLSLLPKIALSRTTPHNHRKITIEKMQEDIRDDIGWTSYIFQTHNDEEVLCLEKSMLTDLKAKLRKAKKLASKRLNCRYFTTHLPMNSLVQKLSMFGIVMDPDCTNVRNSVAWVDTPYQITVMTEASKYHRSGLKVNAMLIPKSHDMPVVTGHVENKEGGVYAITVTPQTTGLHHIQITVDDLKVERDYYSTVCDPNEVINVVKPFCVAVHKNGDIYVGSYDDHIYVFDQGGNIKNTIGRNGCDDGEFWHPVSIFIKGDVMYVADCCNHRIQKLTTEGKFLLKFGERGTDEGQFMSPWGVLVDSNDRVFVFDRDNNTVEVFSCDGVHLDTMYRRSQYISANKSFTNPCGLAFDSQQQIHVSGFGSNTIKVVKPNGMYTRMYQNVIGPIGVVIDSEDNSIVTERDANCLSIFDPHGHKIHTIKNLSKPHGVTLDVRNNSILVANFGCNNVLRYFL